MRTRLHWIVWAVGAAIMTCAGVSWAGPPWKSLIPFKTVEADPSKSYWLSEQQGPWMVMATSFAGPNASDQAQKLVLELRKRYKLEAYMHKRSFDFTEPVVGIGFDPYGGPKKMRHQKATRFDEIAVLVGNYTAVDAPGAEHDLESIKEAKPDCLDISNGRGKTTSQRFAGLRELQRMVHLDPEVRNQGPMRRAFITLNPLLPKEQYQQGGVDAFVVQMNQHVEHSLLDNPGKYTVRVASFRGESYFQGESTTGEDAAKRGILSMKGRNSGFTDKLEDAADKAHRLTQLLRKRGVEAYEFHDRCESIVTIGSFAAVGTTLPDGRLELSPAVHQIMVNYGAERQPLPLRGQAIKPRSLNGIEYDVQPMPIEVPRKSFASGYAMGSQP
ncbi:MAG: hypothetical protein FJ276_20535 [Planctomycetes bacterium]|nr:hypothetical protein [Planctomycetota bacterium]